MAEQGGSINWLSNVGRCPRCGKWFDGELYMGTAEPDWCTCSEHRVVRNGMERIIHHYNPVRETGGTIFGSIDWP